MVYSSLLTTKWNLVIRKVMPGCHFLFPSNIIILGGDSKNMGVYPPNHPILIGFSVIFTIHFGGFPPIFGLTPTRWWFHIF